MIMKKLEQIENLTAHLKELKRIQIKIEALTEKICNTENQKHRDKINADINRLVYNRANEERKCWYYMQDFKTSLEPEMFHLSCMHTYKLWTPNILK